VNVEPLAAAGTLPYHPSHNGTGGRQAPRRVWESSGRTWMRKTTLGLLATAALAVPATSGPS